MGTVGLGEDYDAPSTVADDLRELAAYIYGEARGPFWLALVITLVLTLVGVVVSA